MRFLTFTLLVLVAALLCSEGCRRRTPTPAEKKEAPPASVDRTLRYRIGTLDSASPEAWTVQVSRAGLMKVLHETATAAARHSSSHFLTDEETESLWKMMDDLGIEGRSGRSASGTAVEFTLSDPADSVTLTLPASSLQDDEALATLARQLTDLAEKYAKKTLPSP
jgi:hypothetical protein